MSTSEAQVFARALHDALFGGALQSLKAASAKLANVPAGDSAALSQALASALPADAPREVQNFLQAMAREGVLDRLPSVVQAFEQFGRSDTRALSGEVVSAVELSDEQRTTILNDLRGRYGQQLDVRFSIDPSLIGGLIIRVGDQVLDNSLRARLSAIQRNMLSS